jgi:2-phospho-L-lactate/phosphoenolpyruvate guanylyltransferase
MDAGILAVKRLDRAKRRLGPDLNADQRREVAGALLADALDLCGAVEFLEWWVISDDPGVLRTASARGFGTLRDPGAGLNIALQLGIDHLRSRNARSLTFVPVDVPLAAREDLQDILDTGATADAVVVPSEGDGGTNALYMSPPGLFHPRFGPESLMDHVRAAEELKARCAVLPLPRLSLDLDTAEDVREFLRRGAGGRAAEVLARLVPVNP